MNGKMLITSFIFLFSFGILNAGDPARVGTASGTQLLIPIGAKSIAMGGASLGVVSGAEAIYWNPAGISKSRNSEVLFNNMSYIADIDVNYFALVYNGRGIGAFGLQIKFLDFGDIPETTELFPDGTGNTFSPSFLVAGFSYSRQLTDRINAGATAKFISESIMETSARTFALDLGIQYRFGNNISLGLAMKNVGGKLQYDGRNLERQFQIPGGNLQNESGFFRGVPLKADIPSTFSFGISYTANINEENAILFNGAFTNNNAASDVLFGGIEYGFKDLFYLRGGYNYEVQNTSDQIFGVSFGAGIHYPISSLDFTFDYAFRQLTDYFDSSNIFTIKLGF